MDMLWGVQGMVSLIHSLGTQVKQNIIIISNDVVALQQAKPLGRGKFKFCKKLFCVWVCRSGVPSFSTIDKTTKMLGAKAFWVVFKIFFS